MWVTTLLLLLGLVVLACGQQNLRGKSPDGAAGKEGKVILKGKRVTSAQEASGHHGHDKKPRGKRVDHKNQKDAIKKDESKKLPRTKRHGKPTQHDRHPYPLNDRAGPGKDKVILNGKRVFRFTPGGFSHGRAIPRPLPGHHQNSGKKSHDKKSHDKRWPRGKRFDHKNKKDDQNKKTRSRDDKKRQKSKPTSGGSGKVLLNGKWVPRFSPGGVLGGRAVPLAQLFNPGSSSSVRDVESRRVLAEKTE